MSGGAESKREHVLMVHRFSNPGIPGLRDPQKLFDRIKEEFPDAEVTIVDTGDGKAVSKDIWAKATILVSLVRLPEKLEDVPNLHLIHLFSAGSDHISSHWVLNDPAASHISVTTSSGIHGPPISEWVLMSTLVLTKHYNQLHDWQRESHWGSKDLWFTSSGDWVGKTVGILGYGSIGRQVARLFSAMGARIHAYTHSPRNTAESKKDNGYVIPNTGDPEGTIPSAWYSETEDTLHSFLSSGLHALIISTPLTPSTTNLLTSKEFLTLQETSPWPSPTTVPSDPNSNSASGSGAIIVNISRGKIIKQEDLIQALRNGIIRGAALDVTDPEPLPQDHPLWKVPNTVIAPHISSLGTEYLGRSIDVLRVNMGRYVNGEKLINVVQRGRGY